MPMRILFAVPAYIPFVGGAQSFVQAMARRLRRDGHSVTVLTTTAQEADDFWRPPARNALPLVEEIDGLQIVRLPIQYPWPAPYRFGVLRRMGRWVQNSPLSRSLRRQLLSHLARSMPPVPDLESTVRRLVVEADLVQAIDATWDGLFTVVSRVAHQAGKPLIATPLVHTGSKAIWAQFVMDHQQAAYRQAAAVIALTQREKQRLVSAGIPAAHIHVLPMGVDGDVRAVPAVQAEAFHLQHGLGQPLVAFLGATTYDKGAFTLAGALLALHERGEHWWAVCAGPQQEQLQQFIAAQPAPMRRVLQERMRLLGVVTEETKQTLLAACDILALPSRVDSFGIVLLEAWQQGKPVIAADEGGLSEVVIPGETGLLVPFGNVAALADALAGLAQDREQARQMGEAGRRTVLAHYQWDCTYEALLAIYRHIAPPSGKDGVDGGDCAGLRGAGGGLSTGTERGGYRESTGCDG